ncbi:Dol-P-Glc:Glc(2)Man(9)GlcNAc(2)-PP-Dol alpha-1,2-glucosyltransferase [Citrus sinensis]|uniref:Dol-P-Glc:Glc(2)Man(9)GlcNAc(2)-PP-Dol alpha-1,2-glucosyltransferase n=1 Tax=Citrus sinensis TaxID=2711 RepID=A0ACB8JUL9_CITSI|nr:Dol-P-Glc:Glc(2)Man(9)GlcNAc(2)-PP-Dol alpha-1,2-glucosyltransferase [Citrus sinensis]
MGRIAVAAIVSFWVIPISILVNRVVPEPYMDEIFHVPQAQQYCKGNFKSWDPMITTPPGLYYLSLAYVASLFPGMFAVKAVSFFDVCSTAVLRSTNGVLAVLCSIILYEIITYLRPALDDRKATLQAVVLALFTCRFGFPKVVVILHQSSPYLHLAKLGAFAVLIRQTNIIWMIFVACIGVINITLAHRRIGAEVNENHVSERKNDFLTSTSSISVGSNLRKRKSGKAVDKDDISIPSTSSFSATQTSGLLGEIQDIILTSWHMKWGILVSFCPFLLALLAFIAFIHWNGSVVLGAKEAHAVSPHFAQIMYVSLFSVLLSPPLHITFGQVATLLQSFWKNRPLSFFQWLFALTVGLLTVHFFSIAHPYLLADNRHYPFYLWRKVIKAHWSMKFLLVPLYVYSWFSIFGILGRTQRKIWVLVYFLATAATLVPAPLIEFRYYTIPFYFLILHSDNTDNRHWLLMGVLYMSLNVFTLMMFLFRPFHWDHEPGIQRFICLCPSFSNNFCIQIASLQACVAVMYYASVVDKATTVSSFETQLTALPTSVNTYLVVDFLLSRDGNGLDLTQYPRDPNPIGSDLSRFKMNLDRIWISMCGSKMDLEQVWIYLNI